MNMLEKPTYEVSSPAPAAVDIGLNAAIVSMRDDQPQVLTVRADSETAPGLEELPHGIFSPQQHRTLDIGLRSLPQLRDDSPGHASHDVLHLLERSLNLAPLRAAGRVDTPARGRALPASPAGRTRPLILRIKLKPGSTCGSMKKTVSTITLAFAAASRSIDLA